MLEAAPRPAPRRAGRAWAAGTDDGGEAGTYWAASGSEPEAPEPPAPPLPPALDFPGTLHERLQG